MNFLYTDVCILFQIVMVFSSIWIFFSVNASFSEGFLEKCVDDSIQIPETIPFKCRTLQRGIRMFIPFSEILIMRDVG